MERINEFTDRELAAYTAEKQAEALEQAAERVRHKQHPLSVQQMLNARAQHLREQAADRQNGSQGNG